MRLWLWRRGMASDAAALAALGCDLADAWTQQQFAAEFGTDFSTTLVVQTVTVSKAAAVFVPSPPVGGAVFWQIADELQILNLVIGVASRRQGLGRYLLQTALKHGHSGGQTQATLEVGIRNVAALHLYRSMHFVPVGRRKKYYTASGADAVVMQRCLRRV